MWSTGGLIFLVFFKQLKRIPISEVDHSLIMFFVQSLEHSFEEYIE